MYNERKGLFFLPVMLLPVFFGCAGNSNDSDCEHHAQTFCKEGINYWVDSCGDISGVESNCECGCLDNHSACAACEPDCTGKCCGDDGTGSECPNTCGQYCNTDTCKCETPNNQDVFAYYKDSVFQFAIKDGTDTVKTTRMTWTVTSYNASSRVGTVKVSLDPEDTNIPLPSIFYFRTADDNGLEFSEDGSHWDKITTASGSDINFIFCVKAAKPSSLLGSVSNGVETTMVSYPDGSASGYKVYSKYNSNSHDNYLYTDYGIEYYSADTGFTSASCFVHDGSDYPPFTSKREIDMVSYKVYWPDGTVTEGGEHKPSAPSKLTASYHKNENVWNSHSGTYEKRSYMSLTWLDNSDNEVQFNIYLKATDGKWYTIDRFALQSGAKFDPTYFPPDTFSGSIKAGYYVNWDPGTYHFRLTAAGLDQESEPSNEAQADAY